MAAVAVVSVPAGRLTILKALQVSTQPWEANLHFWTAEPCCSFPAWLIGELVLGSKQVRPEGGVEASESVWRRGQGFCGQPVGGARRWSSILRDQAEEVHPLGAGPRRRDRGVKAPPLETGLRKWSRAFGASFGGGAERPAWGGGVLSQGGAEALEVLPTSRSGLGSGARPLEADPVVRGSNPRVPRVGGAEAAELRPEEAGLKSQTSPIWRRS